MTVGRNEANLASNNTQLSELRQFDMNSLLTHNTLSHQVAVTGLATLLPQAEEFIAQGIAVNTRKAYTSDWRHFADWCATHTVSSLPASPETVACYVTALAHAGRKVNTLTRHLSAIAAVHQQYQVLSPTRHPAVRAVMRGIRRSVGAPPHSVEALFTEDIVRMVATLPTTRLGWRDRALILLGFAGAFRSAELVGLNVEDLHLRTEGLAVLISRSKTDQEGQGRWVGIPYGANEATCPVGAVLTWLEAARITEGAVFRGMNRHDNITSARLSTRSVEVIIKRTAATAGLDAERYSAHSLRSGHCTSASRAGVPERVIIRTTGHRSTAMMQVYIKRGTLFTENSAAALGL